MSEKLKYEYIKKGEKIKAYDFEPDKNRPERFLEGFVVSKRTKDGAKFLVVDCSYDSSVGKFAQSNRVGKLVYVPMELMFSEYEGRVQVIS